MITEFQTREKVVGVFAIGILILLLLTVLLVGRGKDWFRASVTYYTVFNESYNLETNADVRLFNTNIGKVKEIHLTGNVVKLRLRIYKEYASRIRADTVAMVESPTLIGSEYIAIKPGSVDQPLTPPEGLIESKPRKSLTDIMAEFEVEKTAKSVVTMVQGLAEVTDELRDPEGSLLSGLENFRLATAELTEILAGLEAGEGTVGSLVKSRELLESLLVRMEEAGSILADLSEASGEAPKTMTLVQENLVMLKNFSEKASDSFVRLERILKEVDDSIGVIRVILDEFEEGATDVPAVMSQAKMAIGEARQRMDDVGDVVDSLKQNPLIRGNIPEPAPLTPPDAGLRP